MCFCNSRGQECTDETNFQGWTIDKWNDKNVLHHSHMLMPTRTRMCVQSFPYYFVNVCVITNITPPLIYTIGSLSAVNYLQRPGVHSLPFCASQIYYIIKWQDKVSKFILLSEKTLQHFHLTCFVEACISLLNDECSLFTAWTQIQTCALYRKKQTNPARAGKRLSENEEKANLQMDFCQCLWQVF